MRVNEFDYAVEILKRNYDRALSIGYVKMQIAWALYKTWQFFDSRARKLKGRTDNA